MSDNVVPMPVLNEQEIDAAVERIIAVTDDIPNSTMLAALADLLGITASCIGDSGGPDKGAVLQFAAERAWNYAFATFVKRATPKPDNVTPLDPKK